MTLPNEILDKIAAYLPFNHALKISEYVALKLFQKDYHTWDKFALYGDLAALKWLKAHNIPDKSPDTLDLAIYGQHLFVAKWLYYNTSSKFTFYAMAHAAANDDIKALEWLKKEGIEGNYVALNWAAQYGKIRTLKWLHFNTNYGCTEDAMNDAAANGDLDIVKFLNEHRWENNPQDALEFAAEAGHLDVVRYILNNVKNLYLDDAIIYADKYLSEEYQETVDYLKWFKKSSSCLITGNTE